jgi:PUA domain protein
MFKNFDVTADLSGQTPAKASAQRALVQKLLQQYPLLSEETLEAVLPKKGQCMLLKAKDHVTFIMSPTLHAPIFFQQRDGPFFPTLRFLHLAGDFMPILGIDKGGIKFVIKGAAVFCTGITSAAGSIPQELDADVPVAIMCEGKQAALGIGITKLSTTEMKSVNAGVGVEMVHHLNDDLWKVSSWPS